MSRKRLEIDLQNDIVKDLTARGLYHFRYTASTTFGVPDVVAIVHGLFVGIEIKREDGKGRASGLQELTVKAITKSGGLARVISSWDEYQDLLSDAMLLALHGIKQEENDDIGENSITRLPTDDN